MRTSTLICLIVLVCLPALARKEETIEQLKSRFPSASLEEQIKIGVEIGERQVEEADKLFTEGNAEAGHRAVEDVAEYAEKAGEAAVKTGKRLKDTEIAMRKMSRRLTDIKRSLSFEDQPPVDRSIARLEDVRTALLKRMFSKDKKQ